MKIAVSNIAWPAEQNDVVADALRESGVAGIEIAPTKIWADPLAAGDAEIAACRNFWESRGMPIVSAQSLLFGQPRLTLFESAETRQRTLDYLCGIVRLCGRLGAQALVFGSPKNRRVGTGNPALAWQAAVDFFGAAAEAAVDAGTIIVMEANPPEYGADFVTRGREALELVRAVNHAGFRLHLDTACMTMAGDPYELIGEASPVLRHFHVSQPSLAPVGPGRVDHAAFARKLRAHSYSHWISLEMLEGRPFSHETLLGSVRFVIDAYNRA